MTVGELIKHLQVFPRDMTVRYRYDTGYSYPTFVDVYGRTTDRGPTPGSDGPETFVCLDEDDYGRKGN